MKCECTYESIDVNTHIYTQLSDPYDPYLLDTLLAVPNTHHAVLDTHLILHDTSLTLPGNPKIRLETSQTLWQYQIPFWPYQIPLKLC